MLVQPIDRDVLLTVFDPAEHWDHLRTANPLAGIKFTDGVAITKTPNQRAA